MNRWLYYIGFLVLSMTMLFISSCADEAIPPELGPNIENEGNNEIPLMISLKDLAGASTYAGDGTDYPGETPEQGSAWEDAINDVTVYIFNQSFVCEKIISATTNPTAPVMVKTGTKNMVAVVNATGKITLPSVEEDTSYPELLRMLTEPSEYVPTSPFLMTGLALNVPLPDELPLSNPYEIKINVERTVAKVKIKVMKSGLATNANIKLKRIFMYQGADRVALLEPMTSNFKLYNLSDTANTFKHTVSGVTTGDVPNSGSGGYCAMADSFYTFESLCGSDKGKAVRIVLESEVNSSPVFRTCEFYLGEYSTSPGDTVYDVKRNYWYDVTVNIIKPGMDSINVKVKTCPWNVADTIPGFPGDGFEAQTAIPFKLVKNYTDDDKSIDGSFLAIDKHTKGASWIDLKVTEGTPWNLKLKDNSARNENVYVSTNSGTSWTKMVYNGDHISDIGSDATQRIYIYRTYQENNEPKLGPTLYLESGSTFLRDFVIQPRDTTPIPTNCYILRPQLTGAPANETHAYIPLAGVYRYWEDYLLANGDSIPGGNTTPITTSIVWQDGTNVVKIPTVINNLKRDSAYIFVEAGTEHGNALIDMKIGTVTYWSFHIWVTDYNPNEAAGQKLHSGKIFMDRNLGALSNNYDVQGNARGLYYQFGRKDPFPKGSGWSNSFSGVFNSSAMPSVSTVLRPLNAIPASINNSFTFYRRGSNDWVLSQESNNLWNTPGGNKTAFDPCPDGWRIPKQFDLGQFDSPWYGLSNTNLVTGVQLNGRYYAPVGYYPFSGNINTSNPSAMVNTGTNAYYWSSWQNSLTPNTATGLIISTTTVDINTTIDAGFGASVRCVADTFVPY